MLDQHNTYFVGEFQTIKAEELRRTANEPCWVERLARLIWLPLRPVVRLLGLGLQATGGVLIRHTEKGASTAAPRVTVPRHLSEAR